VDLADRVLTVPEAAEFLGVGTNTYYAAAARGEVPAVRIGRRIVVPGAAFERYLNGEPWTGRAAADEPRQADQLRERRRARGSGP
jgi:excisionase family DNA binding protein